MIIAFGADHGGYQLKDLLLEHYKNKGFEVIDFGCSSSESTDYPIYAEKVARAVQDREADYGILCCTTGLGVMLCANKFEGVRAIPCENELCAEYSRRHNNANIITFGQKIVSPEDAIRYSEIFLNTTFEGGRHKKRVEMYDKIISE